MIVTLQTERVQTLADVRAVIDGNDRLDYQFTDREAAYEFIRRTLVRFDYPTLSKPDKGVIGRYLAKMTGLSRAQMTRLVGQHRATGRVTDRRGGAPVRPFERRYTGADIRVLAEVDAALGDMSGPATRAVMRREFEVFGQRRFERLARLSNGHLYNLRRSCQGRRETRPKGGAKHCHRGLRGEMVRGGRDEAGGGVSRKRREGVARPQFPAGGDAEVRSSSPCFARGCG